MKKLLLFIFAAAISACVSSTSANNTLRVEANQDVKLFNILDYGAVGDSVTMNTKAIQSAIDACSAAGGGKVIVPAGKYVTGTIEFKSNVTLSLDYDSYILGSQDIKDYRTDIVQVREGTSICLLYAANQENITIEGLGEIDGRGEPKFFPKKKPGDNRPPLMSFLYCKNLTFTGVTYRRPAFWGFHLTDCENVHFNGVTIRFKNNGFNNDGLDLDGCKNVLIENCDIEAGDDAICLKSSLNANDNYIIRNTRAVSCTAAIKFGASSRGGAKNFEIYNCVFEDCPMGAIKLQLVDGGTMENINISRITLINCGNPIFIRLGRRNMNFGKDVVERHHDQIGSIKNIHIKDLKGEVTMQTREEGLKRTYTSKALARKKDDYWRHSGLTKGGPIMITGIPGHYIENVILENIDLSFAGSCTMAEVPETVKEDETKYPEQFFFGVLPAWGAYIRHAKDITFKNVKLTAREADERQMIVTDDVINFVNE